MASKNSRSARNQRIEEQRVRARREEILSSASHVDAVEAAELSRLPLPALEADELRLSLLNIAELRDDDVDQIWATTEPDDVLSSDLEQYADRAAERAAVSPPQRPRHSAESSALVDRDGEAFMRSSLDLGLRSRDEGDD
jgi:hypothetical protein